MGKIITRVTRGLAASDLMYISECSYHPFAGCKTILHWQSIRWGLLCWHACGVPLHTAGGMLWLCEKPMGVHHFHEAFPMHGIHISHNNVGNSVPSGAFVCLSFGQNYQFHLYWCLLLTLPNLDISGAPDLRQGSFSIDSGSLDPSLQVRRKNYNCQARWGCLKTCAGLSSLTT